MNRRKFLKILLLGGLFNLITKKVQAEKNANEKKLKEAMFWRRAD